MLQVDRESRTRDDVDLFFNKLKDLDCFQGREGVDAEDSELEDEEALSEPTVNPSNSMESEILLKPSSGNSSPDYNDFISDDDSSDDGIIVPVSDINSMDKDKGSSPHAEIKMTDENLEVDDKSDRGLEN